MLRIHVQVRWQLTLITKISATQLLQGQAIYAFVTLMEGYSHPPQDPGLREALIGAVRKAIGAIATPDFIHWVSRSYHWVHDLEAEVL
jgi:hypothetical protein